MSKVRRRPINITNSNAGTLAEYSALPDCPPRCHQTDIQTAFPPANPR